MSRLNDYRAQYVLFEYEKWEICDVVLEGITPETQAIFESMCYGGLRSLADDDMWDLFESIAWHQWQSDDARDPYHDCSSYPHVLCSFRQSFDHNVNFRPYYDVSA